jgi:hypothetical protein
LIQAANASGAARRRARAVRDRARGAERECSAPAAAAVRRERPAVEQAKLGFEGDWRTGV